MKIATLAAWLYAQALTMSQSYAPGETVEAHRERLGTISTAVATAVIPYANGRAWTASELGLAVTIMWGSETLFDERVHAGMPHPLWSSDRGRAKCGGQIHASKIVPQAEWERLAGLDEDATLRCARATALMYVTYAKVCGVWLGHRGSRQAAAMTFAAYASGGHCKPGDRDWERATKWESMMAKRPDRSPVKGFRRAMPQEIPAEVQDDAQRYVSFLDPEWQGTRLKVGQTMTAIYGKEYKLLVENHAAGKVGISVLVAE